MTGVFLFGPLLDDALRGIVAGADLPGEPCVFAGQGVWQADDGAWPVLAEGEGATGLWMRPTADMLDRLDFYAAAFGHTRVSGQAELGGEVQTGWIYRPDQSAPASDRPWTLLEWQRDQGKLARATAEEAMALFGLLTPKGLAQALPTMKMRADSRLRAQEAPAPVIRRQGFTCDDVALVEDTRPYTGYFAVRESVLTHPKFDGSRSQDMRRAAWLGGDAVTVLPYDARRDRVLLVEQFRFGPFVRGDRYPWCLEPIAGRIDPGETPDVTARREAKEEASLSMNTLFPVAEYYPSPGAVSEYLYSYVGLADLPDDAAGLGGLDQEHEDIRAHVLPFAELEQLIAEGEIDNAPLLVSALWLAPRRWDLAG